MNDNLQMAWAVDFLDSPADNLEFRYWSGEGPLTIGTGSNAVTYQGTNGVIAINPPREASGESVRMSIEMDASDLAVREQLRHDIGPLRVRIRWLYGRVVQPSDNIFNATPQSFSLVDTLNSFAFSEENANIRNAPFEESIPTTFVNTGGFTEINTSSTYYARKYQPGSQLIFFFFDDKTNADNADQDTLPTNTNRITLQSSGALNSVIARFTLPAEPGQFTWTPTGKEFIGRLSSPVLDGAVYQVDIESLITDIDRGRVIYWSNDMQQARHSGDKGMEYLTEYAEGINTKWPP